MKEQSNLEGEMKMEKEKVIDSFFGEYRWLSNFYPCEVKYEGITYPTVEHAYQAAKTRDTEIRKRIAYLPKPGQAKREGRKIQIRGNWEFIKISTMEQLLEQKFTQPKFKKLLLETKGIRLIEGNKWGDIFWGMCEGRGANYLGGLLMNIRKKQISLEREQNGK